MGKRAPKITRTLSLMTSSADLGWLLSSSLPPSSYPISRDGRYGKIGYFDFLISHEASFLMAYVMGGQPGVQLSRAVVSAQWLQVWETRWIWATENALGGACAVRVKGGASSETQTLARTDDVNANLPCGKIWPFYRLHRTNVVGGSLPVPHRVGLQLSEISSKKFFIEPKFRTSLIVNMSCPILHQISR